MRQALARIGVGVLLAASAALGSFGAPVRAATAPLQHEMIPSGVPGYDLMRVCPDRHDGSWRCFAQALVPTGGLQRNVVVSGMTPTDLRSAYKLGPSAGSGQTVAIIEGYRYATCTSPTSSSCTASDLAVYRNNFGLPACPPNTCLTELNEFGQPAPLPTDDPVDPAGNSVETMLDAEAVSATCPLCHIIMVYASSLNPGDILAAVDVGRTHANVVSISLGGPESQELASSNEAADDQAHFANSSGVAIVAASGDCGYGTSYPAASPYVTSVGGTSLAHDGSPRGWAESVWNDNGGGGASCSGYPDAGVSPRPGLEATGSGCTAEPPLAYQPVITGCGNRVMNDISAAADPLNGGLAEYDSSGDPQVAGPWIRVGGTSEAAPIVAGFYALRGGEGPYVGPQPLYAQLPVFDVMSGSNVGPADDCGTALCHATPCFDGPTGLGSPNGGFGFAAPARRGYWMVAADGGVFPFCYLQGFGSTGGMHLNKPIVGMAVTSSGNGYYLVASDGGLFPFGDAQQHSYGSTGGIHLNQPIVGMAPTSTGNGYWLVAGDGGIFPFGDAQQHSYGSTGGMHLNQPIVAMAPTATGNGYWLVAGDGGMFPFGDACGCGGHGGAPLNQPIVSMTATQSGNGYWLVARDGGIFPYGDAARHSYGSTGGIHLNQPIVAMTRTASGNGYWLVAADGGIFTFGDAIGMGSLAGQHLNQPIVGMAASG